MAKQMDLKREPGPWMNDYHPEENPNHDMRWFDPSQTRQSEAEGCDINTIMKRFEQTGTLPESIKENPSYGDFSQVDDYHEAQNIIAFAKSQFAGLSARVRAFFDNDPAKMLAYVEAAGSDPKMQQEMVKLGLAVEVPRPTPPPEAQNTKPGKASGVLSSKKGAGGTPPVSAEPEAD